MKKTFFLGFFVMAFFLFIPSVLFAATYSVVNTGAATSSYSSTKTCTVNYCSGLLSCTTVSGSSTLSTYQKKQMSIGVLTNSGSAFTASSFPEMIGDPSTCTNTCVAPLVYDPLTTSCSCGPGLELVAGQCIPVCTAPETRQVDNSCSCGSGLELVAGQCLPVCILPETRQYDLTCGCGPNKELIEGVCVDRTCAPPQIWSTVNQQCENCPDQTVYLTDPIRCEPIICDPPLVWSTELQTCNPPPTCDELRNQCIGECVAVGQGDMDFTCSINAEGNQISTCNCIPPETEYTETIIEPSEETTPTNPPETEPPPETPPEPNPNEANSAVLTNIANNILGINNRLDNTNGYLSNIDLNVAKTVNNLDAINHNIGNIGNKTNSLLTGISAKLTALNHQNTVEPKPLIIGGSLTLPVDNIYDTEIEPLEEVNQGLFTHITNYIASGIPILSTIRNTKIIASGSSIISTTFYGKPFYVDFANWSSQLHMAGIILVFGATVAAFYIVSGKS